MLRRNAKVDLIRSVPLFARCTNRELATLAGEVDELTFPAGRVLAKEGASGREFIVIVDGAADVHRGGRRVNRLGAGDFLGEIALLSGTPRTATVTTTEPSHVLVLTDRAFRRATKATPSIQSSVLQALSERLQADAV